MQNFQVLKPKTNFYDKKKSMFKIVINSSELRENIPKYFSINFIFKYILCRLQDHYLRNHNEKNHIEL